jgi:L-lysine 2,3-aminomutase
VRHFNNIQSELRVIVQRWQKILAEGFTRKSELLDFLDLPIDSPHSQAEANFPTRVPRSFVLKMKKENAQDPLLLQVLAQVSEMDTVPGYRQDPLEERRYNPVSGLIHKYHGRVLLTLTGACAVHCRYCFRRHFPYAENTKGKDSREDCYDYIAGDKAIHEVILSGGDPLMAPDKVWEELLERLDGLSHVRTLRIHSRIPVVLPERLNRAWYTLLEQSRLQRVMVLHANHPNELDNNVAKALFPFRDMGGVVFNQSVLLKGINDSSNVLVRLSHKLFAMGVLPYYLHLLDKVNGAAAFEVNRSQALQLHKDIQRLLPGYLVPKMVYEKAGEASKTWLHC